MCSHDAMALALVYSEVSRSDPLSYGRTGR